MTKRTISEIIEDTPNADELWNYALTAQDKAVRSNDVKETRRYFKTALKYAKASRDKYLEDAANYPNDENTHIENAKLAQKQLVDPFRKMVKKLKNQIFETQIKELDIVSSETINLPMPGLSSPAIEASFTMFANVTPNSLKNLSSLKHFNNLNEINFLTGSDIEKIATLTKRLSDVIKNRILGTDLPGNEVKLDNAKDLINISYDCTLKLLKWIEPYFAEDDYHQILQNILDTAKNAARSAKSIYSLFDQSKVKACSTQLTTINNLNNPQQRFEYTGIVIEI